MSYTTFDTPNLYHLIFDLKPNWFPILYVLALSASNWQEMSKNCEENELQEWNWKLRFHDKKRQFLKLSSIPPSKWFLGPGKRPHGWKLSGHRFS